MTYRNHSRIGIGTCIVAVRTPDKIVVAGDSLRRYGDGTSDLVCKIVQVGNIFFASSGLNICDDTGFDVQKICKEAISNERTIPENLQNLEGLMTVPLKTALEFISEDNPDRYNSVIKSNPITVAFFGIEDNVPVLSARRFGSVDTEDEIEIDIERKDNIGADTEDMAYICMGCDKAVEYSASPLMPDPRRNLLAYLQYVIQWAMDNEGKPGDEIKLIGGPVDILEVDTTGARWIQKKDQCPDIQV